MQKLTITTYYSKRNESLDESLGGYVIIFIELMLPHDHDVFG
jgi:hypothetical protein